MNHLAEHETSYFTCEMMYSLRSWANSSSVVEASTVLLVVKLPSSSPYLMLYPIITPFGLSGSPQLITTLALHLQLTMYFKYATGPGTSKWERIYLKSLKSITLFLVF